MINRGAAFLRAGQPHEAFSDFDRAAMTEPDYPVPYCNRGTALLHMGTRIRAHARVQERKNGRGRWLPALLRRCTATQPHMSVVAVARTGKHEEAMEDLSRALTMEPAYVDALANRAVALAEVGRVREAVADLTAALELDHSNAELLCRRAGLWEELGEAERATQDYARAIEVQSAAQ